MKKIFIFLVPFVIWASMVWAAVDAGNKMCIVSPEDKISGKHFAEYKDVTYGFCCNRCASKFARDPEKYIKNMKGG